MVFKEMAKNAYLTKDRNKSIALIKSLLIYCPVSTDVLMNLKGQCHEIFASYFLL